MSLLLTDAEVASISADLLSAFAPVSARLIRSKPQPDGTGGEEDGHASYREIRVGITNRQDTHAPDDGGRQRTIVTATGRASITEIEYLHEMDMIEIETGDAREFEAWRIDAIVVRQFGVQLSLTRLEDA